MTVNGMIRNLRRVAVLAAAGILLGSCGMKTTFKTETRETGYEGIARTQPFLAAQRLLEQFGWTVENIHNPRNLPRYGGLLFLSGEAAASYATARHVIKWVENGGHAIILAQGSEAWRNDWETSFSGAMDRLESNHLFKELMIKPGDYRESPNSALSARFSGRNYEFNSGASLTFNLAYHNPDILAGPPLAASLASFPYGVGRITLLPQAHPFRNRYIDEMDHAGLLLALAGLEEGEESGEAYFLMTGGDSFLDLLIQRAGMALLALVLLVVLWFWKTIPRFGPRRHAQVENLRAFSEHLRAAGSFLWRSRQPSELLLPIRRSILTKLQQRHPLWLSGDDSEMIPRLAEASGLPPERVRDAWTAQHLSDPVRMIQLISDLQQIQHCL